MSENTDVEYIGKKPRVRDRWFGTGIVWNGPGDIQSVPTDSALNLVTKFTDEFRRADGVSVEEQTRAQAERMVAVIYTGKKPVVRDRWFGSAVEWAGYGDVQEVSASVAARLVAMRDEFAYAADTAIEARVKAQAAEQVQEINREAEASEANDRDARAEIARQRLESAKAEHPEDFGEGRTQAPKPEDDSGGLADTEGEGEGKTESGQTMPQPPQAIGKMNKSALRDYHSNLANYALDDLGMDIGELADGQIKEVRDQVRSAVGSVKAAIEAD